MTKQKDYAVRITGHQKAELQTVERESKPLAPDELAGRSIVTLISAGTELASAYQATSGFPRSVGYAAVFEVELVGNEVNDIQVGDYVFCMGNHRSYQRTGRSNALPLPEGLKPETAIFARMMGVTMSTLTTTIARPPEKVLVTGLGVVGNLAAQNFANCGYEVIACEPDERRRNIAVECGLKRVLPAVPVDDPSIVGQVGLVVDCSGHEQAVLDGCNVIRKRGEVVLIATPWRRYTEIYAHTILHAIFYKYVVMRSGWEWELPRYPTDFRTNSIYGNLAGALKWLAEGRIRVDCLATKVPPCEAQQAYQNLLNKSSERLTYMFDWSDCLTAGTHRQA
ncbi:TPA: zinc-binding alcohol dehydrogenase [Candidatus Poribacteria bacterium]|nr:zinc-binding alcohol dehydrogenase [Candidatus Poribacteria bacterium]